MNHQTIWSKSEPCTVEMNPDYENAGFELGYLWLPAHAPAESHTPMRFLSKDFEKVSDAIRRRDWPKLELLSIPPYTKLKSTTI